MYKSGDGINSSQNVPLYILARLKKKKKKEPKIYSLVTKEQKIGFFGRFIAEKSVFERHRKNLHWKKSEEKKLGKNREKSPIFPIFPCFFFLFIGSKNMKKITSKGFRTTKNAWKWHPLSTKSVITLIIYNAIFF